MGFDAHSQVLRPEAHAIDPGEWDASIRTSKRTGRYRNAPRIVFGPDDRYEVTELGYPYSCICWLRSTFADGAVLRGTGWVGGPRAVITAGHCVYAKAHGWAVDVHVIPRRFGSAHPPYGEIHSNRTVTTKGWVQREDPTADYAAVFVPPEVYDLRRLGAWGWEVATDDMLSGRTVAVSGYPRTKGQGDRLYEHRESIRSVDSARIFYRIDTSEGESGAPLWTSRSGRPIAVGIHTTGGEPGPDGQLSNWAVRITPTVDATITAWAR